MPKVYRNRVTHLTDLCEQREKLNKDIRHLCRELSSAGDDSQKADLQAQIDERKQLRGRLHSQIFYHKSERIRPGDIRKSLEWNSLQQEKCKAFMASESLPEKEKARASARLEKLKQKYSELQHQLYSVTASVR